MILRYVSGLLMALSAFVLQDVSAQTSCKFWITVHDNIDGNAFMQYGNDFAATYNIDAGLGEAEAPPPTPGFDAIWKSITGHPGNNWGRGLLGNDFRAFPINALEKDTFQLSFIIADQPDSNIYLEWPNVSYLSARCDSMFMVYVDLNLGGNVTINMFTQSSIVFPAAGTNSFSSAKIYKYGGYSSCMPDEVKQDNSPIPENFKLTQNYPNPFNPVTKLSFVLGHSSLVTLRIYDVFGREVATLINKEMAPGSYMQEWNAVNVASGVYYYRLQARQTSGGQTGSFVETKKMILIR